VHISAISTWELALLVARGRIELAFSVRQIVEGTDSLPFVHLIDLDHNIALLSVEQREPAHRDPADRFLAATARVLGVPLVTADARLQACSDLETIW
jgi:PIN domain nuclease of toxin-antitoxin system